MASGRLFIRSWRACRLALLRFVDGMDRETLPRSVYLNKRHKRIARYGQFDNRTE